MSTLVYISVCQTVLLTNFVLELKLLWKSIVSCLFLVQKPTNQQFIIHSDCRQLVDITTKFDFRVMLVHKQNTVTVFVANTRRMRHVPAILTTEIFLINYWIYIIENILKFNFFCLCFKTARWWASSLIRFTKYY